MWAAGCVVAEAVGGRGQNQRSLFDAGELGSELALVKSVFSTLGTPDLGIWPVSLFELCFPRVMLAIGYGGCLV